MAGIERWHGEHLAQPVRWASYLGLHQIAPVVDVATLLLRPDSELSLDWPLPWIEGYDLLQQQALWVPYDAVSINSVAAPASTFYMSSNGLAAGNHPLEAVVHGLCEVIERDATALWSLCDARQQLDLSTVDDPCCQQVLDLLAQADVCTAAWDITSDLGIPTYGCTIFDRPDQLPGRVVGSYNGFGCHLSPAIALLRALTEAVQNRVTSIAGCRDDWVHDIPTQPEVPERLQALWEATSTPEYTVAFAAQPSRAAESFEADIHTVLAALRQGGITRAIVVDLSQPDIDIPVVKVLVPGLEGPLGCRPGPRAAHLREEAGA